jgi:WD40 repeat protein
MLALCEFGPAGDHWYHWQIKEGGPVVVAWTAEEKEALVSIADRGIHRWDSRTGRFTGRFPSSSGLIWALAVSFDGRWALSASEDRLIRLWDLQTSRESHRFQGHSGAVTQVVFCPDGQHFLSGSTDGTLRLWNLPVQTAAAPTLTRPSTPPAGTDTPPVPETTEPLRRIEPARASPIAPTAIVPTSGAILRGETAQLSLWNWRTGNLISKTLTPNLQLRALAVSPDGRRALLASAGGKPIIVYDITANRTLRELPGPPPVARALALSADGKRALVGGGSASRGADGSLEYKDCAIRVWDINRGQEICRFQGHTTPVEYLALLPDGKTVLSLSVHSPGMVWLWDSSSGKGVRALAQTAKGGIGLAALSPDGRKVLLGGGGTARIWDVEQDKEITTLSSHPGQIRWMALSKDGKYALTANERAQAIAQSVVRETVVHLWDVATGRELRRFPKHGGDMTAVAFSPDSRHALCSYSNGAVWIFDLGLEKKP